MTVQRVTDFALAFFIVVAVIGVLQIAGNSLDHDLRWLDRPAERTTDR